MDTLADSLTDTASRPLPMRRRADLEYSSQHYEGRTYWVVKDPLALSYYRFQPEERFLLDLLDGRRSAEELKQAFDRRFAPQRITLEQLHQFLGMLHRSGLVIADVPDQGQQLDRRRRERRRRERTAAASNILAIRLPGVDPERLLTRLYPAVRWLFSPLVIAVCCAAMGAAAMLVTVHWETFVSRLPAFHSFFAAENWLLLALVLAVTKVLHELGHALACKHFGGECHEIGLMLLVFTPCLYCNVSDSSMLPSKWQRAAVAAAGMFVELTLAAVATFLWWFSMPGLLNYLALATMFVSSASTVMFNANPLMRFDGYYILADLLEIPNLRQKAGKLLHRKLASWTLGLRQPEDPFLPRRRKWLFAAYAVAVPIYRWIVTISILWFLYHVLRPYGLGVIGNLLALAALAALVVPPLWQAIRHFSVPGRIQQVKTMRLGGSLALVGGAMGAMFLVPIPSAVVCPLDVAIRDAASVYVDAPGQLTSIRVRYGDVVSAGQPLASLASLDLDLEIAELEGRVDESRVRVESLTHGQFRDPQAAAELAEAHKALQYAEEQLAQLRQQRQRLNLTAPRGGTVLPPQSRKRPTGDREELPAWTGLPLQRKNLGATFPAGTLLCRIGDPENLDAVLVIDQTDTPRVAPGQQVEMQLTQQPGRIYHGRIAELARQRLRHAPEGLSSDSGGEVLTVADPQGRRRPVDTVYRARVELQDPDHSLRAGLSGQAKIDTGYRTVADRLWQYGTRTFRFAM